MKTEHDSTRKKRIMNALVKGKLAPK